LRSGARAGRAEEENGDGRSSLSDFAKDLAGEWRDGTVKLYVTFQALQFRRDHCLLFKKALVSLWRAAVTFESISVLLRGERGGSGFGRGAEIFDPVDEKSG
jgi:hypothetical protein